MLTQIKAWWHKRLLFRWERGRQGGGYKKMLLMCSQWPMPFDWYLIKFPRGSFIDEHLDEVEGDFKHWRLNITLKRCARGGKFRCAESYINMPLIALFRPDIMEHSVQRIDDGTRYVLSIGWLTKDRD